MDYTLRQATAAEVPQVWEIIQQAIERRRLDGSRQWQDGYPNEQVIGSDVARGIGYVLTEDGRIAGYAAVLFNDEPAYEDLKGTWLSNDTFAVVHRLALLQQDLGKGLAQRIFYLIEGIAKQQGIYSIKVDTNFDNLAMLAIFEKLGYSYCGEVEFRGGIRKAFEKTLAE